MPVITKELLDEWITGKVNTDEPRVKVLQKKSGPGEYSVWRYMAGAPAFQQREPQRKKDNRKKIILSNAVLRFLAPTSKDLPLVDALIQYYDVYLWRGNNVPLSQSKPIRDSNLFWQEHDEIVGASVAKVNDALTDQGINKDEFIVLDLGAYTKLISHLENRVVPRGVSFAFGGLNPYNLAELEETANSTDTFSSLSIDPVLLRDFNQRFPGKAVEFYEPLSRYINSIISAGKDQSSITYILDVKQSKEPVIFDHSTSDVVYFNDCKFGQLVFPNRKHKRLAFQSSELMELDLASSSINTIELKNVKVLGLLKLPANIESLQLSSATLKTKIQIDQLKYLTEINVSYSGNIDFTKGSATLKTLVIDGTMLREIDFSKFPNLESVKLKRMNCQLKNLESLSKLKTLILSGVSPVTAIDILKFPNLVKIETSDIYIKQASQVKDANWSTSHIDADFAFMPALQNATITTMGKEANIDIARLPLIEKLSISSQAESDMKITGRNTKIQSLTIKNTNHQVTLDLNQMQNLNHLEIETSGLRYTGKSSALKKFVLSDPLITTLDLRMFPDLEIVDLSGCKNLKSIQGFFPKLKELSIKGCPKVRDLDLSTAENLNAVTLDLGDIDYMEAFRTNNPLTIPAIKWPKKILFLGVKGYKNNHLNVDDFPAIQTLELTQMKVDEITSSNLNTIKTLCLKECQIGKLDLRSFSHIHTLHAESVAEILLPEKSPLKTVELFNCNQLSKFDFTACSEVEDLEMRNTVIDTVDLSPLSKLKMLMIINKIERTNTLNVNLQTCHQLRSVKIETILQPIQLNMEGCRDLQFLELNTKSTKNQVENFRLCRNLRATVFGCPDGNRIQAKFEACNLPYIKFFKRPDTNEDTEADIQSYKNESSKVELFDYDSKDRIDSNTADKAPRTASGANKFTIYSQQDFSKRHYRMYVCHRVTHKNGEIEFDDTAHDLSPIPNSQAHPTSIADDKMIHQLMLEADKDPNLIVGLLEVKLTSNKPKAIPTLHAMNKNDIVLYTDPKDAVDILWSEAKKQFYFQPKNSTLKNVTILYKYKNVFENTDQLTVAEEKDLLTPQLIDTLTKKLNMPGSRVGFLFDPNLTKNQKIAELQKYITTDFWVIPLNKSSNNSIDIVCDSILQGKGVCRHRARGFMLLAHLINVPALHIRNPDHQFCEVPYSGKNGIIWSRIDLGGGEMIDLTPEGVRVNQFDKVIAKRPSPVKKIISPTQTKILQAAAQASTMAKPNAKPDVAFAVYEKMLTKMVEERPINNTWELLEKPDKLSPLFMLSSAQDPLNVNKQILNQLSARDPSAISKHIFISEPSELESFLHPRYFANGRYGYEANSQLQHMIKHGGILVIDWSHFSPAQIAGYATLIEKDKVLFGEKVSKDLIVIGLVQPNTEGCEAFHSRCQPIKLLPDFFKPTASVKTKNIQQIGVIEVDLFHSISWRELLLGNKVVINSVVQLSEGPLIQALKKGKKLIIHNPPDDPEFKLLMHRVLDERKILLNGKLLWVPEEFDVILDSKPHLSQLKNVTVTTLQDASKKHIPLGLSNIHEFYLQLEIKDKHAFPGKGLLDHYQSKNDVIYITGFIPEYEWQRLLDEINRNYPNTSFEFQLAPGAEIENVAINTGKNLIKTPQALDANIEAIISSDPDLTTNNLAKKLTDPLIIDVTADMTISDLMYEQTQTEGTHGEVEFHHEEKDMLSAIRSGREVIINGELNEALYQQLLPLLDPNTKLIINGQDIQLKSKLYLVSPSSAKEQFTQIDVAQIEYSAEDYLAYFNDADKDRVKRIIEFHQLAMKLPHSGLGMPTNTSLSLQKIKLLLSAVNDDSPLHRANPIKHVFNYDYPIKSDEYAYLNVLAKYYFSKTDFKVNARKLHELNTSFDLSNKENVRLHLWKILNCLSRSMIQELLKQDKLGLSATPNIADHHIDEIMALIKPLLEKNYTQEHSGPEKQIKQLKQLIKDPNNFIILLKGAPGIGKTYTLKEGFGTSFQGEKDIVKFLQHGGNIVFDEANMAKPAVWDFLKGISRDGKKVYYRGKEYSLMNDDKKRTHNIFVTANPENFPGRYHHPLFQEYGKTVYFQKPPHHYLENTILKKILAGNKQDTPEVMQAILKIYDGIDKINPNLYCSIRDLENVCMRFVTLSRLQPTIDSRSLLMRACRYEFLDIFKDSEHKVLFEKLLEETLQITHKTPANPELIYITPSHPVPNSQLNLIEAIDCQLSMRREIQRNGVTSAGAMKRCIILEGESGIGKSRLFVKMLKRRMQEECKGKTNEEAQKIIQAWDYVQINGATLNVRQVMIDAFYAGKNIILNEINLDNTHEKLLNQLLDGNDEDIKDSEKPEYAREAVLNKLPAEERKTRISQMKHLQQTMMVLASQNPGSYAGRVAISQALRNRSDFHYVDLSKADMVLLSNSLYVDAYDKVKSVNPRINRRHFFEGIRAEKKAAKAIEKKQNKLR